jgi:hypothetical protein
MEPGTHVAKVKAARFIKSKTGTLGFEVAFIIGAEQERMTWVGWLSPKAIDNTMRTLVDVLGFNGNDAVDANGVLTDPKALDYTREVALVIENESYTNPETGNTSVSPRIKWVNTLGGGQYAGVAPESVKNDLGACGFKAAFLAARQNAGKPRAKVDTTVNSEDVPF